MGTTANLELRTYSKTFRAGTSQDGYSVYQSIPGFLELLKKIKDPSEKQLLKWFEEIPSKLFEQVYFNIVIGGCPSEVIFDIPRKLILHTSPVESYLISSEFQSEFDKACKTLKKDYDFEILTYQSPQLRKLDL